MSLVGGYQWFIQIGGLATKTRAHAKQELQGLKSEANKLKSLPNGLLFLIPLCKTPITDCV